MAIDTTNKKLALIEWDNIWESALPMSPGTLGQDDKQQLLWGYPGILWTVAVAPVVTLPTTPGDRIYEPDFYDRIYEPPLRARIYEVTDV